MTASTRTRVLLIEDNPGDARLLDVTLQEAGRIDLVWKENLAAGLEHLAADGADAVLLDLSLPDATGMDTVRRTRDAAPHLPIIVFTGFDDEEMGLQAVQEGCQDYLVKGDNDADLLRRTIRYAIERKAIEEERRRTAERLERTLMQTVQAVSLTLEMRDPYTAGHQRRVAQLAEAIGRRMGLARSVLDGLRTGALIHDIGKINVPAEFLSRPGKLSEAAFHVIQAHPRVGHDIVQGIDFPWPVAEMILQHHEHLDGTGYPNGLKDGEIILEARVLTVADVVEAVSSHRPYRPSLGIDAAMAEIRENAGTKYDPDVVEACVAEITENGTKPLEAVVVPEVVI